MPKKIRELKTMLKKAGFKIESGGGKGSHSKWKHPLYNGSITLAGKDGNDSKPYQEKDIKQAIRSVENDKS